MGMPLSYSSRTQAMGPVHSLGSPGPLESITPSGWMASTSLAGVSCGNTVTSQPLRQSDLMMEFFAP